MKLGDGVTVHGWSDSHAYTVVEIVDVRTVLVQRDKATRTNRDRDQVAVGGFFAHVETDGAQEWAYERDPDGATLKLRRRRDGRWYPVAATSAVSEGRHEHYDYNF